MLPNRNTLLSESTPTENINRKINKIKQSTDIVDIRSLPTFHDIMVNNPHKDKVQGYYVEVPLADYTTFVPNGPQFFDRYNNPYVEGQFDAPLFTLKEWKERWSQGHPNSPHQPELLVNANWFNVWNTGVANVGNKINPRQQARTFLVGLSLSDGELVSTHKVLDQNDVGLDTIVIDTAKCQASLIKHHDIDSELEKDENFYQNKNAVSGFIILKDQQLLKTPDLNNNHNNRLPRTGVGCKKDNNTVVIMVIHNQNREHGITAEEFAKLFSALDCHEAINLDNSGSVELYFKGLSHFGKQVITVNTKTSDAGALTERPKPNCLGFKNTCKATFFSYDDLDIPKKKIVPATKKKKTAVDDTTISLNKLKY